jgi:hypothetical protein
MIASMLWGVILTLGGIWWYALPAPSPITVLSHHSEWVAPDRWRVETRVHVDSACRVAVTRRFNADGALTRQPADSYLHPARPGDLPFLVDARPGTAIVWYEYKLEPSMVGTDYLIAVDAWGCENGYSGQIGDRMAITVGPRP